MAEHEIIDNFLSPEEFEQLRSIVMDKNPIYQQNIGWFYNSFVANENEVQDFKYFYMQHLVYLVNIISPPVYEKLIPVFEKLDIKVLSRIKCNLFPNSEKVHEHEMHSDTDYSHMAAVLYINTCNGYTKLQEDGTKIDSVANRILIFDGSKPHCSTTTNDPTARFTINYNYF